MNDSDTLILERLRARTGSFAFQIEDGRCVALDLTSEDCFWGGLIRHHSVCEKQEILSLICRLTGLRRLNLRRNHLGQLPESFEQLQSLEHLNLGSNHLGQIPAQLRRLTRLKYLHLGNNNLSSVPAFVSELQ